MDIVIDSTVDLYLEKRVSGHLHVNEEWVVLL